MTTETETPDEQVPAQLAEFTNEVLPLQRTRKPDTWQDREAAVRTWVDAVDRNPAAVAVTPTGRLRLRYLPGGMIRVTGTISVNLATAATVALVAETGDTEGLDL